MTSRFYIIFAAIVASFAVDRFYPLVSGRVGARQVVQVVVVCSRTALQKKYIMDTRRGYVLIKAVISRAGVVEEQDCGAGPGFVVAGQDAEESLVAWGQVNGIRKQIMWGVSGDVHRQELRAGLFFLMGEARRYLIQILMGKHIAFNVLTVGQPGVQAAPENNGVDAVCPDFFIFEAQPAFCEPVIDQDAVSGF